MAQKTSQLNVRLSKEGREAVDAAIGRYLELNPGKGQAEALVSFAAAWTQAEASTLLPGSADLTSDIRVHLDAIRDDVGVLVREAVDAKARAQDEVAKELGELKSLVGALNRRAEECEGRALELERDLEARERRIAELESEVDALGTKLAERESMASLLSRLERMMGAGKGAAPEGA